MDNAKLQNIKELGDIFNAIDCDWWFIDEKTIGVLKTDFLEWSSVLDFYYRALYKDFRIEKTSGKLDADFSVVLEKNGSSIELFWFYDKDDMLVREDVVYYKVDVLPLKKQKFGEFIFNVAQSYGREN